MRKKITIFVLTVSLVISVCCISQLSSLAAYENTYLNTGNQREDIIGVAKTQLGNNAGSKYTFGRGNVSWCAYFVVWCARQAGIDSDIIALNGYATADDLGVTYKGRPADRSEGINYIPKRGDLIFFDWEDDGFCYKAPASFYGDHVGIVEYVSGNYVHTIEGNCGYREGSTGPETGLCVRRRAFSLDSVDIKGYGIPNYEGSDNASDILNAELYITKVSLECNELQKLIFNGNNCGIYTLNIYKDGQIIKTETITNFFYEIAFSEPGNYTAVCKTYEDATCQKSVESNTVEWTVKSITISGDINGDGQVNNKDITRLMKYISGEYVQVQAESPDINGDGIVNGEDITRLMRYLSGENIILH